MEISLLYVFPTCMILICGIDGQTCSTGFFGEANPASKSNSIDSHTGYGYLMGEANYIIDCCGSVTGWEAYFNHVVGTRTVYFQIWRPVTGSTYELVGENDFSVAGAGERSKAISQSERISIQPGDTWGWWTSGNDVIPYKLGGAEEDNNYMLALPDVNVGDTQDWSAATVRNSRSYAVRVDVSAGNTPFFGNLPGTVSITNDVSAGTIVFTVTADDIDTYDVSTLTLAMASSSFFSLNSTTGIITTVGILGTSGVTNLVLTVTDQCSNVATDTLTVSITNDPPTINNLPAAATINDDLTSETLVFTINATDTVSTVTCSLTSGGSGKFTVRLISTEYGVYCVDNPGFDYSVVNAYPLSITCSDGELSDTETLTVNLQKNAAPVVINLQNSTTVSTITSIGTTVFTVITTDADNNNLYYTMTCNPASCPFDIFNSGEIQLNQDITNTTTVGYDLNITVADYTDTVGPYLLTITIADINDPVQLSNLPIGSPLTISENTALATTVYTVSYSDIDTSQAHTFTMTSSPTSGSSYFSIDSSSGVISTTGSVINYESMPSTSFSFSVTVTDPITSDTQSFTIDIINVNEAPSFGQASYTLTSDEGVAGAIIGTPNLGTSDPDTGDTAIISMDCGSNSGYFYINNAGTVSYHSNYDLDTGSLQTSVSCTLTVTDSGGLTDTASLDITLSNINDNTPIFSPTSYTFYISFDATSGTTVGTVAASDGDSGTYGMLTFSLNQTNLSTEYFSIDNSGLIVVLQSFPGCEIGIASSVSISALATDSAGSFAIATVVIVISDSTTTSKTTTTISTTPDRNGTFFEDTKNILWLLAGVLALVIIVVCCDNCVRRFRRRNKKKRQLKEMDKMRKRRRTKSTPDSISTVDQLLIRQSTSPFKIGISNDSIPKPPPPKVQQAWRTTLT